VTYRVRRRLGNAGGAMLAALLVAGAAMALGGQAADPAGVAAAPAPRIRTVQRDVPVVAYARPRSGSVARAARAAGHARARTRGAGKEAGGGGAARTRHRRQRPAHDGPAAPAQPVAPATGGYRASVAGTAAIVGGTILARSAAGVALDGSPLDTRDELGQLVGGLPAGRTAFARAGAIDGGAPASVSSSPPAAAGGTPDASTAARSLPGGACVLGKPIATASAEAGRASGLLGPSSSTAETQLDSLTGTRYALVARTSVTPPSIAVAEGTPLELGVRFLGPLELTVRAGGTPGSAAVELGAEGRDAGAPLVEIRFAGHTTRLSVADVLQGGGRTLHIGGMTLVFGGAARAYRGSSEQPPLIAREGTAAAAAADAVWLTLPGGGQVRVGHVEASVKVPRNGIACT
jgi:hypothetical protein